MDEPLSNLDAKLRIQTRSELIRLHRNLGVTTIYVTHDQVEAMTMGQRISVMSNGVLQQCDEPENVYNFPANKFVASFIGSPPMNFLEGSVKGDKVEVGPMEISLPQGSPARSMAGKKVTVGIRPEDIYDSRSHCPVQPNNSNSFDAKVDVLEKLGAEDTVYLVSENVHLTASIDPATRIHVGEESKFVIDTEKIHIFDGESGMAIR